MNFHTHLKRLEKNSEQEGEVHLTKEKGGTVPVNKDLFLSQHDFSRYYDHSTSTWLVLVTPSNISLPCPFHPETTEENSYFAVL